MGRKESRIQSWTNRFLLTIFIVLTTQYLISSPVDDHQERFEDVAPVSYTHLRAHET